MEHCTVFVVYTPICVLNMSLEAIKYSRDHLEILNQLLLPHESIYEEIKNTEDGWQAIRQMKVSLESLHESFINSDLVSWSNRNKSCMRVSSTLMAWSNKDEELTALS